MLFETVSATRTCAAGPPGACRGMDDYVCSGEPSLDELLADPIVRLIMQQDGVTDLAIRRLMTRLGTRRSQPTEGAAP